MKKISLLVGFAILLFSCNNDEQDINNLCTFSVNGVKKVFTCTSATNQYPGTQSNMWYMTWESADGKEKIDALSANGGGMAVVNFTYTISDSIVYQIVDLPVLQIAYGFDMSWGTKSVLVTLSDIPGVGVKGTIANGMMYRYQVVTMNQHQYSQLIDSIQITGGPISAKWTREVTY